MRVLVACEESQTVCIAFRERGHEAYSCDLQDCSGGHPEWHIKGDVTRLLNPCYTKWSIDNYRGVEDAWGIEQFITCDGKRHQITKWNLIIAHPPCTDLCSSGARWFAKKRSDGRQQRSIDFFMKFANVVCPMVAIENPIGIMSTVYRKPDQIIHPWQFAISDDENTLKGTCLWLKGLNPLEPIHSEMPESQFHEWTTPSGRTKRQTLWYYKTRCMPHSERAKAASKTFPGIARAMAEQWGGLVK